MKIRVNLAQGTRGLFEEEVRRKKMYSEKIGKCNRRTSCGRNKSSCKKSEVFWQKTISRNEKTV